MGIHGERRKLGDHPKRAAISYQPGRMIWKTKKLVGGRTYLFVPWNQWLNSRNTKTRRIEKTLRRHYVGNVLDAELDNVRIG